MDTKYGLRGTIVPAERFSAAEDAFSFEGLELEIKNGVVAIGFNNPADADRGILRHVQMHAREYRERRTRRSTGQKPLEKGQIVFYTVPRYPRGQLAEPRRLREIAHSARVQIAAVPSFLPSGSPIAVPQGVLFDEIHGTSEFHEPGIIYHSFDFWWDIGSAETGPAAPRTVSPSVSAAWLWATLELAAGAYDAVGFGGLVDLEFRFEGVKGALFMNPGVFNNYDPVPIVEDDIGVRRTYSIFAIRETMLEQQERSRLDEAIRVIGQLVSGNHTGAKGTKRTLSTAARRRIAAAQRARWAKARGAKASPPSRTMSQAARNKIAAAQRARWAKTRAQQKKAA